MSLQVALHRAQYRHLERLAAIAWSHYWRSDLPGYFNRYWAIRNQQTALLPLCNFTVTA